MLSPLFSLENDSCPSVSASCVLIDQKYKQNAEGHLGSSNLTDLFLLIWQLKHQGLSENLSEN